MTAVSGSPTVADAYRACAEITAAEAKNFSYGIRLLRPEARSAMQAVYALSRRIDDIGDGELPVAEKLAGLALIRQGLRTGGEASDPVFVALGDAARRLPIPLEAFEDLVAGVEMDVREETYPDFDALVLYCRRVAGSVGRLSLGVYGISDPVAHRVADDLGVALQQTNVLRDVREDLLRERTYLPADELEAAGVKLAIDPVTGHLGGPEQELITYLRTAADRAEEWYRRGLTVLAHLDRRSAACTGAMAGIYRTLNGRFRVDPSPILAGRMSLSGKQKAVIALRAIVVGRA